MVARPPLSLGQRSLPTAGLDGGAGGRGGERQLTTLSAVSGPRFRGERQKCCLERKLVWANISPWTLYGSRVKGSPGGLAPRELRVLIL